MVTIYHFDPVTRTLRGQSVADESPLEPGVFLIPANATGLVPPDVPPGKYAAFDGERWQLLDDVGPVPEVIAETPEQTIARYEAALDAHLDATARMHRYDNRFTFALRAAYPGPWHDDGVAFASWMDACNAQAYTLLQSVMAGEAEMPEIADFLAAFQPFDLPEAVVPVEETPVPEAVAPVEEPPPETPVAP